MLFLFAIVYMNNEITYYYCINGVDTLYMLYYVYSYYLNLLLTPKFYIYILKTLHIDHIKYLDSIYMLLLNGNFKLY